MIAVGIYSVNTDNNATGKIHEKIRSIAMSQEGVLQMNGFFVNEYKKSVSLDLVVDFAVDNRMKVIEKVIAQIQTEFPEYSVRIAMDSDVSD